MKKRALILAELRKIAKKHGGLVRPAHVIEAAQDAASPLHGEFVWNNKKAADEYRLWQARKLLAQYWIVEPMSGEPIRLMLSLNSDRPAKAGYRFSEKVLADPDQRAEWLQMALDDLSAWQRQYGALKELAVVFNAIARVVPKHAKAA